MVKILWVSPFSVHDLTYESAFQVRHMVRSLGERNAAVAVLTTTTFVSGDFSAATSEIANYVSTQEDFIFNETKNVKYIYMRTKSPLLCAMTSKDQRRFCERFSSIITSFRPNLVITSGSDIMTSCCCNEARRRGLPVIFVLNEDPVAGFAFQNIDHVLSTSRVITDMYLDRMKGKVQRISHIGSFLPATGPLSHGRTTRFTGRNRILFINPLPILGLSIFLQFSRMAARDPVLQHYRCTVLEYHEGQFNAAVSSMKGEKGVQHLSPTAFHSTIDVLPFDDTVSAVFSETKVLMMPNLSLSYCSHIAIQAISHCIPVVTTDQPAIKEQLSTGALYIDVDQHIIDNHMNLAPKELLSPWLTAVKQWINNSDTILSKCNAVIMNYNYKNGEKRLALSLVPYIAAQFGSTDPNFYRLGDYGLPHGELSEREFPNFNKKTKEEYRAAEQAYLQEQKRQKEDARIAQLNALRQEREAREAEAAAEAAKAAEEAERQAAERRAEALRIQEERREQEAAEERAQKKNAEEAALAQQEEAYLLEQARAKVRQHAEAMLAQSEATATAEVSPVDADKDEDDMLDVRARLLAHSKMLMTDEAEASSDEDPDRDLDEDLDNDLDEEFEDDYSDFDGMSNDEFADYMMDDAEADIEADMAARRVAQKSVEELDLDDDSMDVSSLSMEEDEDLEPKRHLIKAPSKKPLKADAKPQDARSETSTLTKPLSFSAARPLAPRPRHAVTAADAAEILSALTPRNEERLRQEQTSVRAEVEAPTPLRRPEPVRPVEPQRPLEPLVQANTLSSEEHERPQVFVRPVVAPTPEPKTRETQHPSVAPTPAQVSEEGVAPEDALQAFRTRLPTSFTEDLADLGMDEPTETAAVETLAEELPLATEPSLKQEKAPKDLTAAPTVSAQIDASPAEPQATATSTPEPDAPAAPTSPEKDEAEAKPAKAPVKRHPRRKLTDAYNALKKAKMLEESEEEHLVNLLKINTKADQLLQQSSENNSDGNMDFNDLPELLDTKDVQVKKPPLTRRKKKKSYDPNEDDFFYESERVNSDLPPEIQASLEFQKLNQRETLSKTQIRKALHQKEMQDRLSVQMRERSSFVDPDDPIIFTRAVEEAQAQLEKPKPQAKPKKKKTPEKPHRTEAIERLNSITARAEEVFLGDESPLLKKKKRGRPVKRDMNEKNKAAVKHAITIAKKKKSNSNDAIAAAMAVASFFEESILDETGVSPTMPKTFVDNHVNADLKIEDEGALDPSLMEDILENEVFTPTQRPQLQADLVPEPEAEPEIAQEATAAMAEPLDEDQSALATIQDDLMDETFEPDSIDPEELDLFVEDGDRQHDNAKDAIDKAAAAMLASFPEAQKGFKPQTVESATIIEEVKTKTKAKTKAAPVRKKRLGTKSTMAQIHALDNGPFAIKNKEEALKNMKTRRRTKAQIAADRAAAELAANGFVQPSPEGEEPLPENEILADVERLRRQATKTSAKKKQEAAAKAKAKEQAQTIEDPIPTFDMNEPLTIEEKKRAIDNAKTLSEATAIFNSFPRRGRKTNAQKALEAIERNSNRAPRLRRNFKSKAEMHFELDNEELFRQERLAHHKAAEERRKALLVAGREFRRQQVAARLARERNPAQIPDPGKNPEDTH